METKRRCKLISLFLAFVLVFSMLPVSIVNAYAAEPGISYDFANTNAGFAEGKVTINVSNSEDYGTYHLYWADDRSALNGYYEIASVNVETGVGSYSFLKDIAIPPDATKLLAFKGEEAPTDKNVENAVFVYEIPASKQNPYKSADKTLSFQELSDTQLDYQSNVFYTYSAEHFATALENAAQRNVDFITTSGDCINNYENGTSMEWQEYQKIIADSSFVKPIYEANGNHSMKSDINYGLEAFKTATGLGVEDDTLGDTPYYEVTAKNGDHFLFLALESSDSVGNNDEFSTEQLDWLESKLSSYYNDGQHIFIFEHAFFHGYGPGDDKDKHYYSGGLRANDEYPGNKRFKELMDKYTEVFLYTGHSHFDFMYNWNYDNENGKTANIYHVPSTACTTHVSNGKIDYTMNYHDSQCYIVDVYDNMVISNGLNVVDNMIYPAYTYIVDTSEYTHIPVEPEPTQPTEATEESENFIDIQIENNTSYLYSSGAAVFVYNNASGNYFPVDSDTGIAKIPENATDLTVYRCKGTWNSGEETKSDSVTSYWNKYGPALRAIGQVIFSVSGSSNYGWKDGEVIYPTDPTEDTSPTDGSIPTDPTEDTSPTDGSVPTDPTESSETTVYWAIPADYADLGYVYRMNIRTTDGKYPHSARILSDTGEIYNGMKVYSYTFSNEYTREYDDLGISRIQMQCAESTSSSSKLYFQYSLEGGTYTVSQFKDKIFVTPDIAPTGTISASLDNFIDYKQGDVEPTEEPTSSTEPTGTTEDPTSGGTEPPEEHITLQVLDSTSSGWVYSAGAVLFIYDIDTGLYYQVKDGKASVPADIKNITVYRCDGAWSVGNKTDSVASYWNKWTITERTESFDILSLTGDGTYNWLSSTTFEPERDVKYYLVGYFDGVDYTARNYQFDENGKLTISFYDDSYVYIVSSANTAYYTNDWLGYNVSSATLYRAASLSKPDKLYVPSGKVTFNLVVNDDGTLELSYIYEPLDFNINEIEPVFDDAMLGDINNDKIVDIEDAVLVQKYLALMKDFDDREFYCADVYGNGKVTLESAVLITKYAAKILSDFPASDNYTANVSTMSKLINVAKDTLYRDYRYASYVSYANLKEQYYMYKDVDLSTLTEDESNAAYNEFLNVYNKYQKMKENNNVVSVYFCNDTSWKSVKACIYNSETGKYINALENAQGISKVKKLNSGAKIYTVTVNLSKWDKIIFTDGDQIRTVELDVPNKNYLGYYFTDAETDSNGYIIPNQFRYTFDRL